MNIQPKGRPTPEAASCATCSAFAHRPFVLFWGARTFASLAGQVESVTIGWQVYSMARDTRSVEHSALLVGMVGLVQFAPLLLLSLTAGTIADRYDRRALTLLALSVEGACALALAVLAARATPDLLPIFVVAAVLGGTRAFLSPASDAATPMLVPSAALSRAISWNALGSQAGSIIGPWLGGMLCALSTVAAHGASATLYGIGITALFLVKGNTRPDWRPGSHRERIWEGVAYVWTNKIVLGAISLDLFAVLIGGVTALLPVFASDVLNVGAVGFGMLRSGPAVGAVVTALMLSQWPLNRRVGTWMFAGVASFGVATLVFAISTSFAVSLAALAALGAADMISVYVRQTLVQVVTPDHMRGRVSAVSGMFISGSAELGEFETGLVAWLVGPVAAALFGGLGTLAVTGIWAGLFPSLRKADRLDRPGVDSSRD